MNATAEAKKEIGKIASGVSQIRWETFFPRKVGEAHRKAANLFTSRGLDYFRITFFRADHTVSRSLFVTVAPDGKVTNVTSI